MDSIIDGKTKPVFEAVNMFFVWSRLRHPHVLLTLIVLLSPGVIDSVLAQIGDGHILWGDLKVDESKVSGLKPTTFQLILYEARGGILGRQTLTKDGRYRFENLRNGEYTIVVQIQNEEVARLHASLQSAVSTDFRQDISLEWRPNPLEKKVEKAAVVTAANHYGRSPANDSLFRKAEEAVKKRNYAQAVSLLSKIVDADPKDFEAWTELGTLRFTQKENNEAEKAYLRALDQQPSFVLALINLGKLRLAQKNYQGAIEILGKAVTLLPPSAEANYFLGEAYLNIRKGSKAVDYMNEAIRIDPIGKAEIHLRIAAIYDNVGLKAMAAAEYEEFLKKKPDYPDRKKLETYIAENKKK